jgi:hypothetical protein
MSLNFIGKSSLSASLSDVYFGFVVQQYGGLVWVYFESQLNTSLFFKVI